ncbi:unnamed protein product [Lactuca virosa]|uniref:non-specific serine/threonine protein kinase n=1 Tax=Lactuca virosa TaxID=75947 RepID=A0AAU9NTS0_9ASTR|nr:unnamed protein product [Lactuca virosa]
MSSSGVNLEKYRIPLEEIIHATNNFSFDTLIGDGGFGMVYKGQLSKHSQNLTVAIKRLNQDGYQGNNEFHHELEMVSSFHHPNIIPFIGYCDDANEMILVYEYATNGSLDHHLQNPNKRRCITWAQRLKICLGVARGIKYLHSGLGEHMRVIHRDMKSANILLDENLDAKICDFGLSRFGPRNQPDSELLTKASGTRFYIDPIYNERGRLWKESDVYSFGVVLFEMSSGMLAYAKCFGETKEQYLMDLVRSYYEDDQQDDELEKLIDPILKGHIDMRSFRMFNEIAYECVNLSLKERPTMERIIRKIEQAMDLQNNYATSSITTRNLESFRIPLDKINLATENFKADTCIGGGRFYAVGRLANEPSSLGDDDKPQYLGDLFIRNYSELDRLIDPLIRDQIDSSCYEAFTEIAYECITFYGFGGCPTMETIIETLEAAADFQGIEV